MINETRIVTGFGAKNVKFGASKAELGFEF